MTEQIKVPMYKYSIYQNIIYIYVYYRIFYSYLETMIWLLQRWKHKDNPEHYSSDYDNV